MSNAHTHTVEQFANNQSKYVCVCVCVNVKCALGTEEVWDKVFSAVITSMATAVKR